MLTQRTRLVGAITIAAFWTLRILSAAGNLVEFSASVQDFSGEGVTYHRLVFKDGKRVVYYQLPNGWKCNASDKELTVNPSERPFAEGKITSTALDRPVVLDDRAATAFKDQVFNALPPGAQHATVLKLEQNSVLLNNNPVIELILSYDAFGQSFQRSVIIVNTPANQIRFQFSARKSDFDALYRTFRASVLSWEWQPEPEQPAAE
jgi:hypothetical protein